MRFEGGFRAKRCGNGRGSCSGGGSGRGADPDVDSEGCDYGPGGQAGACKQRDRAIGGDDTDMHSRVWRRERAEDAHGQGPCSIELVPALLFRFSSVVPCVMRAHSSVFLVYTARRDSECDRKEV